MKKPSAKTLSLFISRWHRAQKRKDIAAMEELLQPKWLNCWYWSGPLGVQWNQTREEAIKIILQTLNLIGKP